MGLVRQAVRFATMREERLRPSAADRHHVVEDGDLAGRRAVGSAVVHAGEADVDRLALVFWTNSR